MSDPASRNAILRLSSECTFFEVFFDSLTALFGDVDHEAGVPDGLGNHSGILLTQQIDQEFARLDLSEIGLAAPR